MLIDPSNHGKKGQKKQHRLEHKTASIKELSLCYEMCISDLTVYLMELQARNKRIRQTTITDDKFDKETETVKRKLEKVHENWARYKSSLDFTQSFYKDKILQQHQPQSIVTLQSELCDLASNGDPWSDKLGSYAKQGADSILALYENKN
ncbi:hypothetical protein [Marinomonas sp.]|uniref:hypothetical protein n=1 Tax=Marinomonas sp. TaxID=1904862 RepID=UPI003BA9CA3E